MWRQKGAIAYIASLYYKICTRLLALVVVFYLSLMLNPLPLWAVTEEITPTTSLIRGAIDFHVHSAPDVTNRSVDDFELAQKAQAAGMKAVVLKNHVTNTADRAVLVKKIVPNLDIFGGIVLNRPVGGINPQAVLAMYRLGKGQGKVVWLPTIDADYHLKTFQQSGTGIKIAQDGQVLPEVEAVLKIIAKENLVLGTGHISPQEVILVIKRAKELGVKNIVVTHALADVPGLSLAEMEESAALGAFLELAYVNDLMGTDSVIKAHRKWHRVSTEQMAEAIKKIGAEHFVLSTDLGRQFDPLPADGYQVFVKELMQEGISKQEIELMMNKNPAKLLGIK